MSENLFPKKKKKKFKMVLCQRLQKLVPFNARNGMCAYPHKGPLCEGCRKNHSFTLERTASILASELEGPIQSELKQAGSRLGPKPLAKPSQNLPTN
jgi:hypothetical protein